MTVRLTVGQKIFSIAGVILALMIVVAAVSLHYMSDLRRHLHTIATLQVPATEAMARVNVRVLEQSLMLERLLGKAEDTGRDIAPDLGRFINLKDEVAREFAGARKLLDREAASEISLQPVVRMLDADLEKIRAEVDEFSAKGLDLLNLLAAGNTAAFQAGYDKVTNELADVESQLAALRRHMEEMTHNAVVKAERDERVLLVFNSALTVLAALLGLLFSIAVTRRLVGSVRNLVGGTRAVESGHLDIRLEKKSEDEMGELTLSFNNMVGGLRLKERIKDTFGKYLDPRIVARLVDQPEFVEPGGERRDMTVMFIDLKGFTAISERLSPDDLVRLVNLFFGRMTDAVATHQGVVDKFMGDAVMAYWGPPFTAADAHAELACRAALDALKQLEEFRQDVAREVGGGIGIDLRIGISTGPMIVGTVGSKASRSFTVMGDPVNLGSRLEGANKAYGTRILASEETWAAAGRAVPMREVDRIRVVGKTRPVRVFEVAGDLAPTLDDVLAAYRSGDWNGADAALSRHLASSPDDPVALVYRARIAHLRNEAPPDGWDGVWTFDSK